MTNVVSALELFSVSKSLRAQILALISKLDLMTVKRKDGMPVVPGLDLSAFQAQAKSDLDELKDKLDLHQNISAAMVIINSYTSVSFGNSEKRPLAVAISARKHETVLLSAIQAKISGIIARANQISVQQEKVAQQSRDNFLAAAGSNSKNTAATLESANTLYEAAAPELVDPVNISDLLKKIGDSLDEYGNKLGIAIQVANAQVQVERDERGFVDLAALEKGLLLARASELGLTISAAQ